MKRLPLLVLGSLLTLAGPVFLSAQTLYDGSPYTGWASDYTGDEPHTIGLWKFDEPDPSANAYDGGANPNSYSTPVLTMENVTTGVAGKFGEGLAVDPAVDSSRAYFFQGGAFNGSALSVEFWCRTPAVVDTAGWLFNGLGNSSNRGGVGLRVAATQWELNLGNGSDVSKLTIAAPEWNSDTWYHLAVTFENVAGNGVVAIYQNGSLLGGATLEGFGSLALSNRSMTIGNRNVSTYSAMLGTYDNFRMADVAYLYAPIPEPATAAMLLVLVPILYRFRRQLAGAGRAA